MLRDAGKGSVYDYFVNGKTGKFQPWAEVVQEVQFNGTQAMSSIFVPTAETSSLRFFLDLMMDLHKPIMFVGGEGAEPVQQLISQGALLVVALCQCSCSVLINGPCDIDGEFAACVTLLLLSLYRCRCGQDTTGQGKAGLIAGGDDEPQHELQLLYRCRVLPEGECPHCQVCQIL